MIKPEEEKINILVVDDEPAVGDALKLVLEANGYAVFLAETGSAAIRQARYRRFHVGIIDLGLPDTSGLELVKALRELQSRIVVILITAQITAAALARSQNLGAVKVLLKPFRPEDILQLISQALS